MKMFYVDGMLIACDKGDKLYRNGETYDYVADGHIVIDEPLCNKRFSIDDDSLVRMYWRIDSVIPSGDKIPATIPVDEVFFDPDCAVILDEGRRDPDDEY